MSTPTTYTFSRSTDFGSNLKLSEAYDVLGKEFGSNFQEISYIDDTVSIVFTNALNADDYNTLTGIISQFKNGTIETFYKNRFLTLHILKRMYWSKWYCVTRFIYPGKQYMGEINSVVFIARNISKKTNYDIRLYDATHKVIMAEKKGLKNRDVEINDMGSITNTHPEQSIIEIHIKVNDQHKKYKDYVLFESATIYYN